MDCKPAGEMHKVAYVERYINSAYDVVKKVHDNLDEIINNAVLFEHTKLALFFNYVGEEGQTVFTGKDVSGRTLSVNPDQPPAVYISGALYEGSVDVSADGYTVTLGDPVKASDEVLISAYGFNEDGTLYLSWDTSDDGFAQNLLTLNSDLENAVTLGGNILGTLPWVSGEMKGWEPLTGYVLDERNTASSYGSRRLMPTPFALCPLNEGVDLQVESWDIPVTAGEELCVSLDWAVRDLGNGYASGAQITYVFYDRSDAVVSQTSYHTGSAQAADQYTTFYSSHTAPEDAAYCQIVLRNSWQIANPTGVLYISSPRGFRKSFLIEALTESGYYTSSQIDEEIESLRTSLESQIANAQATLEENYYTSARTDEVLAEYNTVLQASLDALSASLTNDYYTKVDTDAAIASAKTSLQASLDAVSATLTNEYLTAADINSALSQATATLQAAIDGVSTSLEYNYYTQAEVDSAISGIQTTLQTNIDNVSSKLTEDYYTSADVDGALSGLSTQLESSIRDGVNIVSTKPWTSGELIGWEPLDPYNLTSRNGDSSLGSISDMPSAYAFRPVYEGNELCVQSDKFDVTVGEEIFVSVPWAVRNTGNGINNAVSVYIAFYADSGVLLSEDEFEADVATVADVYETFSASMEAPRLAARGRVILKSRDLISPTGILYIAVPRIYQKSALVSAIIGSDYYTIAQTDQAIAAATETLQASVDNVTSNLTTNYYTATQTDSAISSAQTTLQSSISKTDGEISALLSGNIIAEPNGPEFGDDTDWQELGGSVVTMDAPRVVHPSGRTSVLTLAGRSTYYLATEDNIKSPLAGRAFRYSGWCLNDGSVEARIGIHSYNESGSQIFLTYIVADANQSDWVYFDRVFTFAEDADNKDWRPYLLLNGWSNDGDTLTAQWSDLRFEEVTEQVAREEITATLTTDYYTKTETDGEITSAVSAAQMTLQSSIDAVVSGLQSYASGMQFILDDLSKANLIGDAVTATVGAASLGQDGTIIVSQTGTPTTINYTNGFSLEIPTETALSFQGHKVKISVLARQPSSGGASSFGVVYATFDNGNSGVMSSADTETAALTTDWQWFVFYYNVPVANNGGTDYIGLFGDLSESGLSTEFCRVVVEVSAEAADLPEIAAISATLSTDYYTIAQTDQAIAAMETTLQSNIDGVSATVSNHSSAISTLQGQASAYSGITVETTGGYISGIKANSWTDPDGTGGSSLMLLGDDVIVPGSLSASSLTIKDFSGNLWPDPVFEDDTFSAFTQSGSSRAYRRTAAELVGPHSTVSANMPAMTCVEFTTPASGENDCVFVYEPILDVIPGEEISVSYDVAVASSGDHPVSVFLRFVDRDGNFLSNFFCTTFTGSASWEHKEFTKTVPSTAYGMQIRLTSFVSSSGYTADQDAFITNIRVLRKRSGAVLIQDGTVTADKLDVTELSAITATIGVLRTATSGERMEIHSDKIIVYDSSNTVRVKIGNLS